MSLEPLSSLSLLLTVDFKLGWCSMTFKYTSICMSCNKVLFNDLNSTPYYLQHFKLFFHKKFNNYHILTEITPPDYTYQQLSSSFHIFDKKHRQQGQTWVYLGFILSLKLTLASLQMFHRSSCLL